MPARIFGLAALIFIASNVSAATPKSSVAYVLRRKAADSRIEGLSFASLKMIVTFNSSESDLRPTVEVKGKFERPGWTLEGPDGKPLAKDFRLPVFLNGRINQLAFVARGPESEKQRERVFVYFGDAQAYHVVSAWNDLLVTAGVGGIGYFQTGFGTYNSATAAVAARYAYDSVYRLTATGAVQASLLTLTSNYRGHSAQILQANVDAAWRVHEEPVTFANLQALVGVNYVTMFTNGAPFGFANLVAPEFGLKSRHYYNIIDAWTAEIRYVALDWRQPLRQNGLVFGLGWSRLLGNSHRLDVSVDFSLYGYEPNSTTWIRASLGTLNLGYTL